jgi:phosphatidylserine/phosphatidylglycerophosphate/cardiolipin synthase-like enzyme
VVFQSDDLVLGGDEHRKMFEGLLRKARYRIIIHSTFVSEANFNAVRPLLFDAMKRGVRIDIFWGAGEEKTDSQRTKIAVDNVREKLAHDGLDAGIVLHPFSTRSHAKFVIADTGNPANVVAVIGSCNWLYSGFQSFEASVCLRDPIMVSNVIDELAELSRGGAGHWTDLANELMRLAQDIRALPSPAGIKAEMAIVLGPEHAQYVRTARDEASTRLFVTSHRLGAATRPAIIVPAIAAADARGVTAAVYYGIASGGGETAAGITMSAAPKGVRVQPVIEPRLHAKMLAWDNDYLLITSQNWLSADPSEANRRREIGIFIHAPGIARTAIDRFDAMRRS